MIQLFIAALLGATAANVLHTAAILAWTEWGRRRMAKAAEEQLAKLEAELDLRAKQGNRRVCTCAACTWARQQTEGLRNAFACRGAN